MNSTTDRDVVYELSELRHYPHPGFEAKLKHPEGGGLRTLKETSPFPARDEELIPMAPSFLAGVKEASRVVVHLLTGPELTEARKRRSVLRRVLTGINHRWVTQQTLLDVHSCTPVPNNDMEPGRHYYLVTRTGNLVQVRCVYLVFGESEGSIATVLAASWHGKRANAPAYFKSIINAADPKVPASSP
jgi:hypothetical protein